MSRHALPRHRHRWSDWSVVNRSYGTPYAQPVRYDDGTLLWVRWCTFEQCPRKRHRVAWPPAPARGRHR